MPIGKYFFIKSKLNGLVLDIKDADDNPGTKVQTWNQGDASCLNQLWWQDSLAGCFRSKLNEQRCLDFDSDNNCLVISAIVPGQSSQQWYMDGEYIANREDYNLVLGIDNSEAEPGATVVASGKTEDVNQQWELENVEASYFWIQSHLNGKVLDIAGDNADQGAEVIMWDKKDDPSDNQLWYQDNCANVRSKLNDFFLDGSGCEYGKHFCMCNENPCAEGKWWTIKDNCIVNYRNPEEVMDIEAATEESGAKLIPFQYGGGANQMWNFLPY